MSELQKTEQMRIQQSVPATDILEQEDGFHIVLDMPGVDKKDLVIDLKENELTIQGKSSYAQDKTRKLLRSEFEPSEFTRTFSLTDMVDQERIKAVFQNGVLNLFVPKAQAAVPRRIEIETD